MRETPTNSYFSLLNVSNKNTDPGPKVAVRKRSHKKNDEKNLELWSEPATSGRLHCGAVRAHGGAERTVAPSGGNTVSEVFTETVTWSSRGRLGSERQFPAWSLNCNGLE